MRFWDSSAIVPLLLEQPQSAAVNELIGEDDEMVVWWSSPIECASAVARLRREGCLAIESESTVLALLRELAGTWYEIRPSEELRDTTLRLLRTHSMRAADALQLAAALAWAGTPRGEVIVTFDDRLGTAAQLEGLTVVPRAS
ncbi:MAG TPA: type II toxin-antitoxin system VapC family toxin [Longimicrobiales bacterium]